MSEPDWRDEFPFDNGVLSIPIPEGPAQESLVEDFRQMAMMRFEEVGLCRTCGCDNVYFKDGCDCTNIGWCGCSEPSVEGDE